MEPQHKPRFEEVWVVVGERPDEALLQERGWSLLSVDDAVVRVVDNTEIAWPGHEGLGRGRFLVVELSERQYEPGHRYYPAQEWLKSLGL